MVIGGQYVETPFPVSYRWGLPVAGRRTKAVNGVIVHHGATTSADQTFRVLKARGLGTHFEVDRDATVWQYADPLLDVMSHASEQNGTKVGLDLTGPSFTPAQLARVAEVIRFLSGRLGFPLTTYPWDQRGFGAGIAGVLAHHQTAGGVASGKPDPSGAVLPGHPGWQIGSSGVWEILRQAFA